MSVLLACGLGLGLLVILAYVICSRKCKKKPDLPDAIQIIVGTTGMTSGFRLMVFVFTSSFSNIVHSSQEASFWNLTGEDGMFIFLGGLAMVWVSFQSLCDVFKKALTQPK